MEVRQLIPQPPGGLRGRRMEPKNIFQEGELQESSVCKESLQTASDGKYGETRFYIPKWNKLTLNLNYRKFCES